MNDLQIFENSEFGKLEVIMINNEPHFPATECAKILAYGNPHDAIKTHCAHIVKRDVSSKKLQVRRFIIVEDIS
jgi:prophage antirepressor-like protein